jgi:ubiquitin-conjugating enzyme E2 Q
MTGHITIGGSICMEILTNQLWIPSLMLNKVVLMIVQNMISGGAELDSKKYNIPYSYDEAVSAYKRMIVSHSDWK